MNNYSKAFKDASPIVAGYFTVSFIFGLMCVNQGMPVWVPVIMSFSVYAGASQFSFLSLSIGGASILTIVLSTFLINLRHMLMSVYMSNAFDRHKIGKGVRFLYAFGLTDESFASHSVRLANEKLAPAYLIAFNLYCHASWVAGSLLGGTSASYASDILTIKLDYALTAMMLYVLVSLINTAKKLLIAIVSIVTMCILNGFIESHLNVFFATSVGCWVGSWKKKVI